VRFCRRAPRKRISFVIGAAPWGRSLRDLLLRSRTGVTIIAVVRDGRPFTNPEPELRLATGDVLVMLGSHQELATAMRLLDPDPENPI